MKNLSFFIVSVLPSIFLRLPDSESFLSLEIELFDSAYYFLVQLTGPICTRMGLKKFLPASLGSHSSPTSSDHIPQFGQLAFLPSSVFVIAYSVLFVFQNQTLSCSY